MNRCLPLLALLCLALIACGSSPAGPGAARLLFVDQDGDWDTAPTDLAVVEADGSGLRRLRTPTTEYSPMPSPDGLRVAVNVTREVTRQIGVYLMAADGTSRRRLVPERDGYSFAEAWSPDGRRLLYTLWLRNDEGFVVDRSELWAINANGSGKRRLARRLESVVSFGAAWSPDGTMIAFVRRDRIWHDQIWVVNADGTNAHAVAKPRGQHRFYSPVWLP